jgi:hypothetical protein
LGLSVEGHMARRLAMASSGASIRSAGIAAASTASAAARPGRQGVGVVDLSVM